MATKIEFFLSPDGTVNYQEQGKSPKVFDDSCIEIVEEVLLMVRDLYPEAYAALSDFYKSSKPNKRFFEFKMVQRFIRCNFGEYDGLTFDIDGMGRFNFEHVSCPMRGECRLEGIVCRPRMQTKLTQRENEVVALMLQGYDRLAIADELRMSPYTVTRHFANIRNRLGLATTAQILTFFKDGSPNV